MIARTVKIQLTVFAVLAAIALLITGVNYVGLNKDLWSPPFTVKAHFPSSGGIFTNAEVTYRGVTIGRVGTLHLTKDGVIVDLKIDNGEKVPARTHAQVEELSAVGEQYVDLRPYTDSGPYLKNGSEISLANTSVPIDENTVLVDLDNLVKSVPQSALQTTVSELGKAFNNAGPSLQQLITRGNEVLKAFQGDLAQTISLIEDAKTVLGTQIDVSGAFQSFASNIANVSDTLRSSDPDIRRLLDNGVLSATQVNGLLKDNQNNLGSLLGNVVTLGQIQLARLPGLDELLTLYPRVLSAGARVVQDPSQGARFGLDTDMFPVCTKGYAPASTQVVPNNTAAQDNRPFPLGYTCTEPLNSGTDVRGSREAPRPPGDTTDPALGGYAYGQAAYVGSADGRVVDGAGFDPSSGLVSGPNGQQYLMGASGGQAEVLGANSWKYLLLAPLTS